MPNGNDRGNAAERRARRRWLLETFGDGITAPCSFGCGRTVDADTMTVDRYPTPGVAGGRYTRDNIRPACLPCNSGEGSLIRKQTRKEPSGGHTRAAPDGTAPLPALAAGRTHEDREGRRRHRQSRSDTERRTGAESAGEAT